MTASDNFAALRDKATDLARATLETRFQGHDKYHATQMQEIAEQVPAEITEKLAGLSENFKFVVTCQVIPKAGASRFGIHASNSCILDVSKDGSCTIQWENGAIFCLV
eukprot:CAMPEP_0171493014 /NCGR_PEP_ID=MMETSP0958-20121227/4735_1 /TAXON_ID=87120 /ORGANISM="Aurantiochytrium limacinum, Strain ATCCMYA-1381" /LENGTH=107 /DNA_ID=CAMNT_0012026607 /DNA_START=160 /DNA_END=480 /DNA_ORIENTATION=+